MALFIGFAGCTQPPAPMDDTNFQNEPDQNQAIVGNDRDSHGCIPSAGYSWCEAKQKCLRSWEEPCEENNAMTEQTAREIAQNSSACQQYLSADANATYNETTATWWFDLDIIQKGCSPACVVFESDENAEINWRCTGLVSP